MRTAKQRKILQYDLGERAGERLLIRIALLAYRDAQLVKPLLQAGFAAGIDFMTDAAAGAAATICCVCCACDR